MNLGPRVSSSGLKPYMFTFCPCRHVRSVAPHVRAVLCPLMLTAVYF